MKLVAERIFCSFYFECIVKSRKVQADIKVKIEIAVCAAARMNTYNEVCGDGVSIRQFCTGCSLTGLKYRFGTEP